MAAQRLSELITVQNAADRLAVSRWMIYRLIRETVTTGTYIEVIEGVQRNALDSMSSLLHGREPTLGGF